MNPLLPRERIGQYTDCTESPYYCTDLTDMLVLARRADKSCLNKPSSNRNESVKMPDLNTRRYRIFSLIF
jgi:hypothetical protein